MTSLSGPTSPRERELLPDALRGFALFGILLVNIMSFANGLSGSSLGDFTRVTTMADRVTVAFVAFLAEFKFYPIFSFLFGYGFALFWTKARRRGADAGNLFYRRIGFLGLMGVLHGVFIWFGDILSRYALVALFLKQYLNHGPKRLLRAMRTWLIVTLAVAFGLALLMLVGTMVMMTMGEAGQDAAIARDAVEVVKRTYSTGNFAAVTAQRCSDYVTITIMFLFLVPQVLLIFLTGVFVARAGWLRSPAKHQAKWRRILAWSLAIGVPVNLVWAVLQMYNAQYLPEWFPVAAALLDSFMPVLAGAYVAGFALLVSNGKAGSILRAHAILRALSYAGRMPLTNYIAQSVICSILLYGYGFGLGDDLRQAKLALLAIGIYVTQLVWSRVWLSYFELGPLEAFWRRVTYAK
jgi:uncharacterized protein